MATGQSTVARPLQEHSVYATPIPPCNTAGDFASVGTIVPGVAATVRRTAEQQVLVVLGFL